MPTTLDIVDLAEGHSHVRIVGPLDLAGVGAIELRFTASTASRRTHAIVDMSQVPFMASLGMGMLVQVARTLAAGRHKVILLSPTEIVATALRTARLDAVMPIAPDLEAAHGHLRT
jgi:anti-anti-sigma factor